jgi:iron complex transport system substrate-binding protein
MDRIAARADSVTTPVRAVQISQVEGGYWVWGDNTVSHTAIELAGGTNLAAALNGIQTVNLEELMSWDPEVIFIPNFGNASRDIVLQHPLLSATQAARSGRVYVLPTATNNWGTAGEDDPMFLSYAAALLYPEVHATDLEAEIQQWIAFMFGRELTDEEMQGVLQAERNAGAPNYAALGLAP